MTFWPALAMTAGPPLIGAGLDWLAGTSPEDFSDEQRDLLTEQSRIASLQGDEFERRAGVQNQFMQPLLETVFGYGNSQVNKPRDMAWGRGIFEPKLAQRGQFGQATPSAAGLTAPADDLPPADDPPPESLTPPVGSLYGPGGLMSIPPSKIIKPAMDDDVNPYQSIGTMGWNPALTSIDDDQGVAPSLVGGMGWSPSLTATDDDTQVTPPGGMGWSPGTSLPAIDDDPAHIPSEVGGMGWNPALTSIDDPATITGTPLGGMGWAPGIDSTDQTGSPAGILTGLATNIGNALAKPENQAAIEIIRTLNDPGVLDMIASGAITLPPGLSMGANGVGIAPGFSVGLVAQWFNDALSPGSAGGTSGPGGTTAISSSGQLGFGFDPEDRYGVQGGDEYNNSGQRG